MESIFTKQRASSDIFTPAPDTYIHKYILLLLYGLRQLIGENLKESGSIIGP